MMEDNCFWIFYLFICQSIYKKLRTVLWELQNKLQVEWIVWGQMKYKGKWNTSDQTDIRTVGECISIRKEHLG